MSLLIVGCDAEQADQDPSEIGSTKYKPTLTITPSVASGDVAEGTAITYQLSTDKIMEFDINFKASLVGGTASGADFELGTGVIGKFKNNTTITVEILDDMIPENDETAIIKIEADGLDSEFWIIPNNTLPEFSYTIKSSVNPTDLVVALEWDAGAASDLDMWTFSEAGVAWSNAATSDNPEVGVSVEEADDDGVYFVGFDPYDVNSGVESFEYSFHIGTPDGTVKTISGTFDYAARDEAYDTMEYQGTVVYLLLKVVKTGMNYVVTAL